MHKDSIRRVKASFAVLAPDLDRVSERFFAAMRLAQPSEGGPLPRGLTHQRFSASLALLLRNIDRLDLLAEPVEELGARHAGAVRPEHYPLFRDRLIDAMAAQLGDAWSDQLAHDYRAALNAIAALMLRGAARAALELADGLSPPRP